MDSIFLLEEGDRAALLEQIMQALGCVYICLRAYFSPPYNCLKGLDGIYHEGRNQQTTSHGSFVRRLFDVYREASTYVDAGLIPGIAFASNNPFMKLELHEFQSLISSDFQLQFYQEAGIKTIVLMGCATGEIELGMSDNHNQVDIEAEMKNILQTHFPNQPPSSSSSSLLSVSVDSPEYPPLLFNIPIPTTTTAPPLPFLPQETLIREPPTTTTAADATHDQTRQMLSQFRHAHFPSIECEHAAMTNAILAVLSSPSTSTSSHRPPRTPNISTAFRAYQPNSPARRRSAAPAPSRFKRAMMFFNNLNHHRTRHDQSLPTATQLHHMISERKRREKLNESFQILRSFLPPGTKKDKASVLSSTVEYMSSLKSRVAELAERNRTLESQIDSVKKSESGGDELVGNGERVSVEISRSSSASSSSTSEARLLELRVRVRGECSLLDLVSRVIEFLRGQSGVSLTSVESNTRMLDSVSVHAVIIRLTIQGDEFDESGFREGVKRAVDDQLN